MVILLCLGGSCDTLGIIANAPVKGESDGAAETSTASVDAQDDSTELFDCPL